MSGLRSAAQARHTAVPEGPLRDILHKARTGVRLNDAEALELWGCRDLHALAAIASAANERRNQAYASFIVNRYINYSNYCILSCQFCAFARKKRDQDGFQLSLEEIITKAHEAAQCGATELHIVGGLHPSLPFGYYVDMVRGLKSAVPGMHLKCFTAIEILHLAWLGKRSVHDTLRELREAGLDAVTGGGAEIFAPAVRSAIAKGKESAEEWLEVHRIWHGLGGRSTCTMLYGHVERVEDRVDHLRRLRELQDETGGFVGFVPLPYQPENNEVPVTSPPTGLDTLRTIAVSRAYLDNFEHVTAYWVGMGLKLAQVALAFGADDLHGTIIEEKIFHMAGAQVPQQQTAAAMVRAIREAGRVPVQRSTFYERVRIFDGDEAVEGGASSVPSASAVLGGNLATA